MTAPPSTRRSPRVARETVAQRHPPRARRPRRRPRRASRVVGALRQRRRRARARAGLRGGVRRRSPPRPRRQLRRRRVERRGGVARGNGRRPRRRPQRRLRCTCSSRSPTMSAPRRASRRQVLDGLAVFAVDAVSLRAPRRGWPVLTKCERLDRVRHRLEGGTTRSHFSMCGRKSTRLLRARCRTFPPRARTSTRRPSPRAAGAPPRALRRNRGSGGGRRPQPLEPGEEGVQLLEALDRAHRRLGRAAARLDLRGGRVERSRRRRR